MIGRRKLFLRVIAWGIAAAAASADLTLMPRGVFSGPDIRSGNSFCLDDNWKTED